VMSEEQLPALLIHHSFLNCHLWFHVDCREFIMER
jgi:hypothetical protein